MNQGILKWSIALSFSIVVHIGMTGLYREDEVSAKIAGGSVTEIVTLGEAFSDSISAGSPDAEMNPIQPEELVQQTDQTNDVLQPSEVAETVQEVPPEPVTTPTQTEKTSKPPEVSETVKAEVSDRPLTTVPKPTSPIAPDTSADVPTIVSTTSQMTEAEPVQTALLTDVIEPMDDATPSQTIEVPEVSTVPVPSPRQKQKVKRPKPKKVVKKPKAEQPKRKTTKVAKGNAGKQKSDARAGVTNAAKTDSAKKSNKKTRTASVAGNARVSNYPGKVQKKLRRAKVRPKEAKRKKMSGKVLVAFVISKNGSVSGVRVVRGSGHSILDKAAVNTVRRAAPFPKIPDGAGRSRWAFNIPIVYR